MERGENEGREARELYCTTKKQLITAIANSGSNKEKKIETIQTGQQIKESKREREGGVKECEETLVVVFDGEPNFEPEITFKKVPPW